MLAVWSFWTKPFGTHHGRLWLDEKYHLLSWVLSLETARRHFPETALYTDDEGAARLIDGIGLEFGRVSTALSSLQDHDPEWWTLGKLYTYRAQTEAFVHLDSDVFLWKGLPETLRSAPVLAQNPECFDFGDEHWYRPLRYESALRAAGGWLPEEWAWYTARRGRVAASCGILGGQRTDFLRHYADRAIRMIEHPANCPVWPQFDKIRDNILFEQYLLAACVEYGRAHPDTGYGDVRIGYLFDSMEGSFAPEQAERMGYTHLIARAKRNPALAARLEDRVRRDYPACYGRVMEYLAAISGAP